MKRNATPVLLALAIAAASPLALAQQHVDEHAQAHSPMHEPRPDAWVLAKVKAQFAASSIVDATDINVDVDNGVVKLTGTVAGAAEKQEAMRLARQTEGVDRVDVRDLKMAASAADAKVMDQHEIEEDDR